MANFPPSINDLPVFPPGELPPSGVIPEQVPWINKDNPSNNPKTATTVDNHNLADNLSPNEMQLNLSGNVPVKNNLFAFTRRKIWQKNYEQDNQMLEETTRAQKAEKIIMQDLIDYQNALQFNGNHFPNAQLNLPITTASEYALETIPTTGWSGLPTNLTLTDDLTLTYNILGLGDQESGVTTNITGLLHLEGTFTTSTVMPANLNITGSTVFTPITTITNFQNGAAYIIDLTIRATGTVQQVPIQVNRVFDSATNILHITITGSGINTSPGYYSAIELVQGIAGGVASVNNILPDASGNTTLDHKNLGVNLANNSTTAPFNVTSDQLNIPVTGILPLVNGGTNRTDGKSPALVTPRNLAVNLANNTTQSPFDGTSDQTNIEIQGILPIQNGGTGNNSGEAQTAIALKNAQDISITGAVTAPTVSFNGTSPVTLNATLAPVTRTNTTSAQSIPVGQPFSFVDSITTNAAQQVTGVDTKTLTFTNYNIADNYQMFVQSTSQNMTTATPQTYLNWSTSRTNTNITVNASTGVFTLATPGTYIITVTMGTTNVNNITANAKPVAQTNCSIINTNKTAVLFNNNNINAITTGSTDFVLISTAANATFVIQNVYSYSNYPTATTPSYGPIQYPDCLVRQISNLTT